MQNNEERLTNVRKIVFAFATTLIALITMWNFGIKAQAATITVSPSSATVNKGDTVNISSTVSTNGTFDDVSPVGGYNWTTSSGEAHMPNEVIGDPTTTNISFTGTAREAGTFTFTVTYNMNDGTTANGIFTLTISDGSSSSSSSEPSNPEPQGPSAEEIRQQEIEAAYEDFIKEGNSIENKTVGNNKSSVNGFFYARNVNGVAVQPTASDKNSYVRVADTDKNKSKNAIGVANLVASTYKGTVGPCLNVNYGNMVDGKFVPSTTGSAGYMWIGIPGNFRINGAKYSVIAIYEGGSYKIFNNIVNAINPADSGKILINLPEATSANVMYALVRS